MTPLIDSEATLAKRALPVKQQLKFLAAAIALFVGIAGLSVVAAKLFANQTPSVASEPLPPNTFHATEAQLAGLKIETVSTARFRTEELTDGKIALNADATTSVFSPYSGRVIKLLVGIGDYVKQGAPLIAIEATEFSQAQSDVRNAQAQLKLATINEARKHAAFDAKGGSLQDWQQAQVDLTTAQSAMAAAQNRLRIFGKTDSEIQAIADANTADGVTYVVAPISGVIADRQVGPGQYIQADAASPIYTIADLSTVWLVANVREIDAPRVQRGQGIEVKVLAFPDKVFTSKISSVGASVDPATHRVPVRAVLDNSAGLLKPEMFASFSIASSDDAMVSAVPADAVIYEGSAAHVWIVQGKSDIGLREIRVGRSSNGMVEVTDGLTPGEKIVTRGSLFIDRAARPD